jgi:myo-inositol-1(or 4)-monophosphatase
VPSRFERELAVAQRAARRAGELLLGRDPTALTVDRKADRSLVTDADLAAEQALLAEIRQEFPGDAVLSEEAGSLSGTDDRCWVLDPLDGTSNYSRGLPLYAVSVALLQEGCPAAGVVYMPVFGELFCAVADGPAALNGRPIRVSETERAADAMVNIYFDRADKLEHGLALFAKVARVCEGRVKCLGSTASVLCFVAAGRLDAYVKNGTRVWDYAAGALILERAGGRISDLKGEALPWQPALPMSAPSLLATNGRLHAELQAAAQA